jgi:hypothetical protein
MKITTITAGVIAASVITAGTITTSAFGAQPPAVAAKVAAIHAAHAAAHAVPKGFVALTVDGVTTFLPGGQAVLAAQAACVGRAPAVATVDPVTGLPDVLVAPADLTVDAVRLAFPAPVLTCTGVTLRSQVAAEAPEVED